MSDRSIPGRAARLEQRAFAAIELLDETVAFLDPTGRLTSANRALARLHGLTPRELIGRRMSELAADDETLVRYREIELARTRGCGWSGTVVDRRTDGGLVELELRASPLLDAEGGFLGWIEIGRDLRLERSLESQLRQAVKMAAIGRLASSVAHDFNNLLTAIRGFAELHLAAHRDTDEEDLNEIMAATDRAADLIAELMAASRETASRPVRVDLPLIVHRTEPLLRQLMGEDVVMRFEDDEVPQVLAHPGQIEAILLNLAANARDAMAGGGTLTVRVLEKTVAEPGPGEERRPGRYVMLSVSDSGSGMDEVTRSRMFEPLFTTKGPGKGTGLGLASVQSMVHQAGGFIEVESAVEAGTTLRILFPALTDSDKVSEAVVLPFARDGERRRILLVEDDCSVRAFATRALEGHGYSVTACADPAAALEAVGGPDLFDALVTDVVMPGLSGVALAREVAEVAPALPVLYMSGHFTSNLEEGAPAGVACISKPFAARDLAAAVGRLFMGEASTPAARCPKDPGATSRRGNRGHELANTAGGL